MTEVAQKKRSRRLLWITLTGVMLVLAATFVPPAISINRYKGQIAALVARSLGRPVQVSSVELRLLPWPSFILSNLSVEEEPAYGAEPVLHADTVIADVRLLALWRGRLEIGSINVDSASLNLVRMPGGRWNLDPLFRTVAAKAGAAAGNEAQNRRAPRLPYLEATQSRINFKNGVEKLPFSIVNAQLSLWEDSPGDWHLRLKGQPARTDVSLFQEDTGIVQLDASLHSAPALRDVPLHVELEWRQAQLGQLSRLLTGSDPGWRGNLTADLHLDGTPETAHVTARLQAAGVHRAEFAPAEPLDFDANCGFVYHYSIRALENLVCDSPLGNGHIRVTGDLPGAGAARHFTASLDRMPVDAVLGFLRTVRSGIDPGLTASGSISGKMTYSEASPQAPPRLNQAQRLENRRRRTSAANRNPPEPVTGRFTIHGFELSGGGLDHSLQVHRIVLEPKTTTPGEPQVLIGTAEIAAGESSPLILAPRFTVHGYQLSVRGDASLANVRQLAQLAGVPGLKQLNFLTGGPISVAIDAQGPWLLPEPSEIDVGSRQPPALDPPGASTSIDPPPSPNTAADSIGGTITVHNANWKPDYLAHNVVISQATVHVDGKQAHWDPVDFSFGTLKATASLSVPAACAGSGPCPAHFELRFGKVDAAELQSAILGARPHTSLFDSLIDRLHLSSAPAWPSLEGTVQAESLTLGPLLLQKPVADLKIDSTGATIESLDARVLDGDLHASGTFAKPDTDRGRPVYALDAAFSNLSAPAVGRLLGMRWAGGPFEAKGKIELSGLTAHELADSAKGTVHFEWRHGAVESTTAQRPAAAVEATKIPSPTEREIVPPQLTRFTTFNGDAEVAGGKITLANGDAVRNGRDYPVDAQLTLGGPREILFAHAADSPAQISTAPHESARK